MGCEWDRPGEVDRFSACPVDAGDVGGSGARKASDASSKNGGGESGASRMGGGDAGTGASLVRFALFLDDLDDRDEDEVGDRPGWSFLVERRSGGRVGRAP